MGLIADERPAIANLLHTASLTQGNGMQSYLTMMAVRLLEMWRVLKDTGSIYLHCDPTASHYLKLLMDAVFGQRHFRNEIVWAYRGGGVPQTPGQRRRIPRGRRSAPKRRLRRPRALTTRHRKGWLETPQGNYITSADPAGGHGRTTETGLSTMLFSGFLIVTAVPHTRRRRRALEFSLQWRSPIWRRPRP